MGHFKSDGVNEGFSSSSCVCDGCVFDVFTSAATVAIVFSVSAAAILFDIVTSTCDCSDVDKAILLVFIFDVLDLLLCLLFELETDELFSGDILFL